MVRMSVVGKRVCSSAGLFQPITRREAAWLAVGSLAFALVFSYPLLCDFVYLGPGVSGWITQGPRFGHLSQYPVNGDWDSFTQLRWVPYWTVLHFHQWPFWNPYKCGGMPMLANPEASIVTPFFLLDLLLGIRAAVVAEIVLHLVIAFSGGYVLARAMKLSPLAAVVCGSVFPASSWFFLHMATGHLNFLPATYLPWIAALLHISIDRRCLTAAALSGLCCALTFTEGNYSAVFAVILVGTICVIYSMVRVSIFPLLSGIVTGLFAAGFSATKLIPAAQLMMTHPRAEFGPAWDTFQMMLIYVFSRDQDFYRTNVSVFGFHEYGGYISLFFALLACASVAGSWLALLPWLVGAIEFFHLAMGNTQPYSLITFLSRLPFANDFHLPARFVIPFVFSAGVVAALGAEVLIRAMPRWGGRIVFVLIALGLADSWLVGPPNLRYSYHEVPQYLSASPEFRQVWSDNPFNLIEMAQANQGSVHCPGYGEYEIPTRVAGYNQPGYRGECYLEGGVGRVSLVDWSPNRLSFELSMLAPGNLIVNQNYYPGWTVVQGSGKVFSAGGLIAVAVPRGQSLISLAFRPTNIVSACVVTLITILALAWVWRRETRG
jgi:hypothetical protein